MARCISLIDVPYDSGYRDLRMGCGPGHFLTSGAVERLRAKGAEVERVTVKTAIPFQTEISTAFDLHRLLSDRVRRAVSGGAFPLVLAGNCNSAIGTVSGLTDRRIGVVWFDGHGDFNTPETTVTGYLDGMGLATVTGRCWQKLAASVPGFRPIPEDQVVLVGARDFDDAELAALRRSDVALVGPEQFDRKGPEGALEQAIADLETKVDAVYVHIDLDVHDPMFAPANEFSPPNGLKPEHVKAAIAYVAEHVTVGAAALASYDPAVDSEGRTVPVGLVLMELVAEILERQSAVSA